MSQVEESIAGRRTKVALSVHGASNMLYTVVCVHKLLTHYVYIQKYLNGFVNMQCTVPLKFTYEHACRTLILLRKMDFYEQYTESNILPQKVILLQLHNTCEKNLVTPYITFHPKVMFIM